MGLGEAAGHSERLRRFYWRDAVSFAASGAAALPRLIEAGWRADALRRVLFVPALMGLGIGFYFALNREPPLAAALVGIAGIGAWLFALRTENALVVAFAAFVAACTVGFSLAIVRADLVQTPLLQQETRTVTVRARVERLEPADAGRTRLWLRVFDVQPTPHVSPERVRISIAKLTERIGPGDWIEVRAQLRPLPAPVAPGSFDFGRKLWFEGIGAVGFSLSPIKRIAPSRPPTMLEAASDTMNQVRRAASDRIVASMSPRAGPIGAAFLTGERGMISEEDNEAMRDSSLAHLLSISGLHMALAGFGFFGAVRLAIAFLPSVALNYPVKKWAAGAALVASAAYLLLSGASVPTQRSFVMIAVALIAIICDRAALTMRTVAIAAAVVLVLTPEAWMDPSFQMSFAAVVALIAAYEWWNGRRIPDAEQPGMVLRAARMIGTAAVTSLIAGLATAPFAAFHFNRFADYGVVANVIVMPIVSFIIMPAGVLAMVLMPFGLEAIPLAVMSEGIEAMLAVAHWVSSWPGAAQSVAAWPVESIVLIACGGLWAAVWQAGWRWLGLAPAAGGLALALTASPPDVLIADDGANVAVRDAGGQLELLSSRRGRFDAEIWLRRDGDAREVNDAVPADGRGFACDDAGCIADVRGLPQHRVVIAWSGEAATDDCDGAVIVLDLRRGWGPGCERALLSLSRRTLDSEGAIAAWFDGAQVRWTSVARERGQRPWSSSGERGR